MCRNQLAKVYKHLGNKECLRKNQRKVYAKDLDAACWVKYPHNIKVVINTAQICRWMALGITIATIVVGCTIAVGLFEWCDRSWMENRN